MAVSIKERRNKDGKITSFTISNYLGKDNNGKLIFKYKTIKVDPNMKESAFRKKVQEEAIIFERDLAEGRITASTQRFGDYLDYVLNLKKERETCKITTLDGYNHMRTGILSVFGRMKVTDIKPEHLNRFYTDLMNGTITGHKLSPKTVRNYHGLISTVLQKAYKEGIVTSNVAERAELPKLKQREIGTIEPEQIGIILNAIRNDPIYWKASLMILIHTGIRRGELLGLKWDKIDLQNKTIEISNNLLIKRGTWEVFEDTPKTQSSNRKIGITNELAAFLRTYKAIQTEQRLLVGDAYNNEGWVIANEKGNPIYPESLTIYCEKLSRHLGFHITPHMFRHTQASVLIANNVPVTAVAQRLGHSQVSTTMNIYSHALKNADSQCTEILEKVYSFC